jgi:hypothetical protein
LRGVARELTAVGRERERAGWTPELVSRVLTALRVAAAFATSRPVTQVVAAGAVAGEDGALIIPGPWFVSAKVRVSASVTAAALAAELSPSPARHPLESARRPIIEALADAVALLTLAQYGSEEAAEPSDLDAALGRSARAVARLRRDALLTAVKRAAFRRRADAIGSGA